MISFSEVSKQYPKGLMLDNVKALSNLTLAIAQGQTLGLIGANGAGKSTSIRLIMDFIRPDSGTIELFSSATQLSHTPELRQRIGYLPEVANFPANLTLLDLLGFTAATCGIPKEKLRDESHRLLTQFDLWAERKRPLRTFSKGMQQRANFAIALINDPELLILDEPMSGLDPIGRKKIIDLIGELKASKKTILFCSHILEDVDRLVDHVLLLDKGQKLFHGPPAELAREEGKTTMAEAFVSRIKREEGHG